MSITGSQSSTPTSYTNDDLVRNPSSESAQWVIQKYGGTSVGKSLDSICQIVECVYNVQTQCRHITYGAGHISRTRKSRWYALPARQTPKHSARRISCSKLPKRHSLRQAVMALQALLRLTFPNESDLDSLMAGNVNAISRQQLENYR